MNFPHVKTGLIAGGQLAKMMMEATKPWGLKFHVLDPEKNCPACSCAVLSVKGDYTSFKDIYQFGKNVDVLTYELENINVDALLKLEREGVEVHPEPKILKLFQNKYTQKQFYREKGLPVSSFWKVDDYSQALEVIRQNKLLYPLVFKTLQGGYDGRGVIIVHDEESLQQLEEYPYLLEPFEHIEKELAVVGARNVHGDIKIYEPVEMVFDSKYHLVSEIFSPAEIDDNQRSFMRQTVYRLLEELKYTGVLAVEFFLLKSGGIVINETAPRVHNSGHLTIESAVTSQFKQHIRAVLGLPLGPVEMKYPAAMFNLVGPENFMGPAYLDGVEKLFAMEGVYLHWYEKAESRPGRKMGHVTAIGETTDEAREKIKQVKTFLKIKPCQNQL